MINYIEILVAIVGCIITALSGFVLIPFLKKIHFGQTILDIGPKWHKNKQGTPIMGGFMFMLGTIVAILFGYLAASMTSSGNSYSEKLFAELSIKNSTVQLIAGIVMALLMAFIGFMDDYIKAVKKQNLGLKARQKTFMQLIVGAGYLMTMYCGGMTTTVIPFIGTIDIAHGLGLAFWPIALIFIYGFTNAVNLTDGVDGLASSVTFVVSLFYLFAANSLMCFGYSLAAAAVTGSLAGFLFWNLHPAKVFMGDTGSMFLGGIVVAFAFAINRPILLIFSGILYLVEAMSVVIQVAYYKKTKKRLFKMSPIHHHFELCSWSENKIVIIFSLTALIGCTIAMLLLGC